jgi:hypothetical protein
MLVVSLMSICTLSSEQPFLKNSSSKAVLSRLVWTLSVTSSIAEMYDQDFAEDAYVLVVLLVCNGAV